MPAALDLAALLAAGVLVCALWVVAVLLLAALAFACTWQEPATGLRDDAPVERAARGDTP